MTLTRPQLAAYGALGLPLAAAALPVYVHLPNLYGGVLGMNLALLGAVLLVARLADAVVDPLLGALADRLQRPRLLIALGVALLVAGLAAVFNPPGALWWWLAAALVPLYLGFSLASIAFQAWGALLGETPHERTRVSAWREGFGLAGVVLASVAPTLLAPRMEDGLSRFTLVLASVAAVCASLTLLRAPQPARAPARAALDLGALAVPFANPAFKPLFAAFIANGIAAALPATLVLFFVNDALGAPQLAGAFLAAYFLAGAASLPLWTALARRMGKRNAWLASMAASVAAFAGALALGAGDVAGFAAVCLLSGLALGGDLALPPAMLADAIRARGDEPRAGAYFGLWNFATKLNLALAAGLALPLLAAAGYVPGTSTALAPLYFAYCLVPCALKLAAAAVLWRTHA
ncbi:MAG: MFS transporter [Betaproteobacteria bacterium]|nr:MFS transporter [Betaproteobacteria bacterium]MDH5219794.1 MFS transporter [Betaproteobacteria bacterium]MDH5351267.1 MFS transporter [Betaproteobacteria bacterium]